MPATTQRSSPRTRTRDDLYDLIRTSDGLTRAELVDATGLSRSTVNSAVVRLLDAGRVVESDLEEKGPGSGSGRPATRLRVAPKSSHVAGVDFGHSHIYVALADASGEPVGEQRIELDVDLDAAGAMDVAADLLARLQREHDVERVSQLVAGIPGPLDTLTGLVRSPTILSSWVGLSPADELTRRTGVPVVVENDAVLGAYGELRRGAGRHYEHFLYVKASHGIGASIVIGRAPFRGSTGLAGEIGHTRLPGHTEMCRCGNRGCLEAVLSVETVREQIRHAHPGAAEEDLRVGRVDDPVTRRILDEAGRTLGGVLADLCNLLNPEAVVVGGELGLYGAPLLEGIRAAVDRHAQPATAAALEVVAAELGTSAELVGALQTAATAAAR
ncbi:ROK family transcriptional regulator [Luteimicrobium subarcticum]|nr:ROK family transcriptional regulator [Luteimicrobium subarcticum]